VGQRNLGTIRARKSAKRAMPVAGGGNTEMIMRILRMRCVQAKPTADTDAISPGTGRRNFLRNRYKLSLLSRWRIQRKAEVFLGEDDGMQGGVSDLVLVDGVLYFKRSCPARRDGTLSTAHVGRRKHLVLTLIDPLIIRRRRLLTRS
jgi:hypothetical protein